MVQKKLNCTLIIPTHERHAYLERILDYYSNNQSFSLNIIVVDSSEKRYDKSLSGFISYMHVPQMDLGKKMLKALNSSKTSYTLICADDDFIISRTINKCITFLDDNEDYSSAQGKYLSFNYLHGFVLFQPYYVEHCKMSVESEDISTRLKEQFSPYMHQLYSVFRTEELSSTYEKFSMNIQNYNLIELSVAIQASICGKHKIFNELYCVRESIFGSASSTCDNIDVISSSNKYKKEYQSFLKINAETIVLKEKVSKEKALFYIKDAMQKYMDFIENPPTKNRRLSYSKYMKNFSKFYLSEVQIIKKQIKKHHITNHCNLGLKSCLYLYLSLLLPVPIKAFLYKILNR